MGACDLLGPPSTAGHTAQAIPRHLCEWPLRDRGASNRAPAVGPPNDSLDDLK
jgi:hypothetical protein